MVAHIMPSVIVLIVGIGGVLAHHAYVQHRDGPYGSRRARGGDASSAVPVWVGDGGPACGGHASSDGGGCCDGGGCD